MRLYDEVIHESLHLLEMQSGRKLRTEAAGSWRDTGKEAMILRSEMAYEIRSWYQGMKSGCTEKI